MVKVSPVDTKIELACSSTKMILLYLADKYGRRVLEKLVSETKMNLGYLEDQTNWISFDYYCRFLEKVVEYTGDPKAPLLAGTYASQRKCFGQLALLAARLGTVESTYRLAAQMSPRWNKVNTWTFEKVSRSQCKLRIHTFLCPQHKNNCLSIQGIMSVIPELHGLPRARVKEVRCASEGGNVCEYEIAWLNKPVRKFGAVFFCIGTVAGLVIVALAGWGVVPMAITGLLASTGYFMGRVIDYKMSLKQVYQQNEEQATSLIKSIKRKKTF